jgi:hypothetical protein
MRIAPTLVALLIASCGDGSSWERSRTEYCERLQTHALDSRAQLEATSARMLATGELDEESARMQCDVLRAELWELAATQRGFLNATHVVALGRPEGHSVEQAGFELDLGTDQFLRYDSTHCARGDYAAAARSIDEIGAQVRQRLDAALERCRSVGWSPRVPPL